MAMDWLKKLKFDLLMVLLLAHIKLSDHSGPRGADYNYIRVCSTDNGRKPTKIL